MNKIKAYSILELMVVMLISMIVMGIAYQGYLLFYKQFLAFKTRSEAIAEQSLMDRLLLSDITDSRAVLKSHKGIDCLYADKTIAYEWENNYTIRKEGAVVDSFHHETLEGLCINYLSKPAVDFQLVDEVIFVDSTKDASKVFHYIKRYAADIILNNPYRSENGRN